VDHGATEIHCPQIHEQEIDVLQCTVIIPSGCPEISTMFLWVCSCEFADYFDVAIYEKAAGDRRQETGDRRDA